MRPEDIKIPMIYNKKTASYIPPDAVYVGRPKYDVEHHYGNPFTHLPYGKAAVKNMASAAVAVQAYRDWLDGKAWHLVEPERREWILQHVKDLKGKDLICWCVPNPCHATVLVELANA